MTDLSKPILLGHCRGEVLETLVEEFDKCAARVCPDATKLEVLVAAVTYTLLTAEFIPNPAQRRAMLDALVETSLQ